MSKINPMNFYEARIIVIHCAYSFYKVMKNPEIPKNDVKILPFDIFLIVLVQGLVL